MLEQRIAAVSTDRRPPTSDITPAEHLHGQTGIDSMHAGELAVAIHAGGIPATWRSLSTDQIRTLAETGLSRLGLHEVQRVDRTVRAANLACAAKDARDERSVDVSAEGELLRQVWSSRRVAQVAADLAFRLICARSRHDRATPSRGIEDPGKSQAGQWFAQRPLLAS